MGIEEIRYVVQDLVNKSLYGRSGKGNKIMIFRNFLLKINGHKESEYYTFMYKKYLRTKESTDERKNL